MKKITIQQLKDSLIKYNNFVVKSNTTGNHTYESMAQNVWANEIFPFIPNENVTTWELDIKKKFIDNPYCRYEMSEKQAYCLARAYANLNKENFQ